MPVDHLARLTRIDARWRKAYEQARVLQAERHRTIVEASDAGVPTRQIAGSIGLSTEAVRKILRDHR